MAAGVADVTLRPLMTMSGGFGEDPSYETIKKIFQSDDDLVGGSSCQAIPEGVLGPPVVRAVGIG